MMRQPIERLAGYQEIIGKRDKHTSAGLEVTKNGLEP
jgi:hypothetical protein